MGTNASVEAAVLMPTSGGTAATSAASGGAAASSTLSETAAERSKAGLFFFLGLQERVIGGLGLWLGRELFLLQNIGPPMMVNLVHKLQELQSPQPPPISQVFRGSSRQLLKIAVVFIVQIIQHSEEITGEVPDVSPPLTQG